MSLKSQSQDPWIKVPLCGLMLRALYLYIYISSVHMLVDKLLLNGSTDFDEIFCVSSGGFHNGLDKQFGPI